MPKVINFTWEQTVNATGQAVHEECLHDMLRSCPDQNSVSGDRSRVTPTAFCAENSAVVGVPIGWLAN